MIITFARLQRLSSLERPTAVKRRLQKRAIAYIEDSLGQPFTTLEAINERLRYGQNRVRTGSGNLAPARDYSGTTYEEDLQFPEQHERWRMAPNRYGLQFDSEGEPIDFRGKKQQPAQKATKRARNPRVV